MSCCNPTPGPTTSFAANSICANNGAICNVRSNTIITNNLVVNGVPLTPELCNGDPATYTTFDPIPADASNPATPGALLSQVVLQPGIQFARTTLAVRFADAGAAVTRLFQIELSGFSGGPIGGNPALLFQITAIYADNQTTSVFLDVLPKDANTVSVIISLGDPSGQSVLQLLMTGDTTQPLVFNVYGGSDAPGSCSLVHTTNSVCI